ncbi:hypothetical protein QTI66_33085 [Variovorax sp. J22R133]|uniref:hypothetical protein n=1 Tax=Variovorax brevis TaxID=3053503 RepID=UPI002575B023|nr:hypothetical protein [Variovorax sp. J22R133]MDM0116962.1 hypothetical protein [Variovorax sp. J22R133]
MHTDKHMVHDHARWKTFFACYADWFISGNQKGNDPDDGLFASLQGIEKSALSKKDLRKAIRRTIELTSEWTPEQVGEADAWLAAAGTFTLSEVRRRYWGKYFQILKHGTIRSEAEYDLIKGVVECGGIESGTKEETKLRSMLADFEAGLVASLEVATRAPPMAP